MAAAYAAAIQKDYYQKKATWCSVTELDSDFSATAININKVISNSFNSVQFSSIQFNSASNKSVQVRNNFMRL